MAGQFNTNEPKQSEITLLPSFLPLLPSTLLSYYNGLNSFDRGVLVKMYSFLWGVVNHNRFTLLSSYWGVEILRLGSSLSSSSLVVLSYLYQLSYKGVKFVHSDSIYNGVILPDLRHCSKMNLLLELKRAGYITRHTKDPGQPYSQRAQHNKQPVYIRLTGKGVQCVEQIEKDLYKLLLNTSLNDLTGANKKP